MNLGQRRRDRVRKDVMSRFECLERESHTALQKRDHVSFVSWRPFGRRGMGVVKERIWRSSDLV